MNTPRTHSTGSGTFDTLYPTGHDEGTAEAPDLKLRTVRRVSRGEDVWFFKLVEARKVQLKLRHAHRP
jgi:hypothetical protein